MTSVGRLFEEQWSQIFDGSHRRPTLVMHAAREIGLNLQRLVLDFELGARDRVLHCGARLAQMLTKAEARLVVGGDRLEPLHAVIKFVEVQLDLGTGCKLQTMASGLQRLQRSSNDGGVVQLAVV
eukprot:4626549-Prymnesium_polylepis.1